MSKIYEALQKAQEEREGALAEQSGPSEPSPKRSWWRSGRNGKTNGNGNGNGNGNAYRTNGELRIDFDLAPQVEEAYQRLGTNLLMPTTRDPGMLRDLMVVASEHQEGATTTAALFASTLAKRKKLDVLLIEANFRSPALEHVFPIRRNGGFAELIDGRQTIEHVVQATPQPNLFVVTSGHYETSPAHVLESNRLSEVLAQLHERFQFVVFDSAPVNTYTDASILAPRLDAAVFVIEADRTRVDDVQRAKRQLERSGSKILGVLLNRRKNYVPAFLEGLL